jgi:hypothetical protein
MTTLEELIKEMPPEIQQKAADVLEFLLQKRIWQPQYYPKAVAPDTFLRKGEKSNITEKAKRIALARAELLRLYRRAAAQVPEGKKCAAKRKFVHFYNLGYFPQIYAILKNTSLPTVERWNRKLRKTGDPFDLAPQWGKHRKDKTKLTPEQQRCLLATDPLPHDRPVEEAVRIAKDIMKTQGLGDTCSDKTYIRFLKKMRSSNFET